MFDVEAIRRDFPILSTQINGHKLVYFDNGATSQRPRQVIDGITQFYEKYNANPKRSIHDLAEKSTQIYNESRENIARFINAEPEEIVFVRNTTEAINLISHSYPFKAGDRVATTYLEHHSNLLPWLNLKEKGIKTDIVDVDFDLNLEMAFYKKLPKATKLVTVSHESNVSGTINDVRTIAKLAHEQGADILVDAAQSVPHMNIDVKDIDADFLAFSGHKMLGPFGIGVLYIKKEKAAKLKPFLTGGEMIKSVKLNKIVYEDMPSFFEAGTQNIEGAYGLSLAVEYLKKVGMRNIQSHERKLMDKLYKEIKEIKRIVVYSGKSNNYGPILSFNLEELHSHDIAYLLNKKGIAIRSGFHCAQPLIEDKLNEGGTARASLYLYNTEEEVDIFVRELEQIALKYG